MRWPFSAAVFLVLTLSTASCERSNPVAPGEPDSTDQLVTALQQQGAIVVPGEVLPQGSNPFFSTNARMLSVNSGRISAFEYATAEAADRDAAKVSPDGSSVGNTMISWIGPPHFYKSGRIIVIYAGSDAGVLQPLGAVLGRPFAER